MRPPMVLPPFFRCVVCWFSWWWVTRRSSVQNLPLQDTELDRGDDDDDEQQHHRLGGGVSEVGVAVSEGLLVDRVDQGGGRMLRAAAGEDVDLSEALQGVDGAGDHQEEDLRGEQGDDDGPL